MVVRFYEKYYVGRTEWNKYVQGNLTYFGTDAAFDKRKETADGGVYGRTNKKPPLLFDNVPISGFKITDSGYHDKITIQDPRGYHIDIDSNFIVNLIKTCTIKNGIIKEALVWLREGTKDYLEVAETSADYKKLSSKHADRKWNVGDVFLDETQKIQYLGQVWASFSTGECVIHRPSNYSYNYGRINQTAAVPNVYTCTAEHNNKRYHAYIYTSKYSGIQLKLTRTKPKSHCEYISNQKIPGNAFKNWLKSELHKGSKLAYIVTTKEDRPDLDAYHPYMNWGDDEEFNNHWTFNDQGKFKL